MKTREYEKGRAWTSNFVGPQAAGRTDQTRAENGLRNKYIRRKRLLFKTLNFLTFKNFLNQMENSPNSSGSCPLLPERLNYNIWRYLTILAQICIICYLSEH